MTTKHWFQLLRMLQKFVDHYVLSIHTATPTQATPRPEIPTPSPSPSSAGIIAKSVVGKYICVIAVLSTMHF